MIKENDYNKLRLSCIYKKLVLESENLTIKLNNHSEERDKLNLKNKIWWIDNRATWIAHCIALCGDLSVNQAIIKLHSTPLLSNKVCCAENPWLRGLEFLQNNPYLIL